MKSESTESEHEPFIMLLVGCMCKFYIFENFRLKILVIIIIHIKKIQVVNKVMFKKIKQLRNDKGVRNSE